MSKIITSTPMYVKNKDTGELQPVSMITGSNKELEKAVKENTDAISEQAEDIDNLDKRLESAENEISSQFESNVKILDELKTKITKPETGAEVGKILAVKEVREDGSMVVEWIDAPSGGGCKVQDVTVNGSSVVREDGTAVIPLATNFTLGLVGKDPYGMYSFKNGLLNISTATLKGIKERLGTSSLGNGYIFSQTFDQAVKHALCDTGTDIGDTLGKPLIWTEEEQQNAQIRLGIYPMSEEGYGYGR